MATAKKAAAKASAAKPAAQSAGSTAATSEPASNDEVLARGGWGVGYVGDRVDETPNEAYTVTGVVEAAKSGK